MAQTKAVRRRWERDYKRRTRSEDRAAGKPGRAAVNAAIVEATSYCLTGVNIGLRAGERAKYVNTDQVVRVALKILCTRQGYDFDHSKAAVVDAVGPRPEHRWPSHVPSWSHVLGTGLPPGEADGALQDVST